MTCAVLIKRLAMLALVACGGPLLVACEDKAYCFNCTGPQGGEGGTGYTGKATGGSPALSSSAGNANDDGSSSDTNCDTDTKTDPFNCGKCGRVCKSPHGMIASCRSGICSFDCASGHWDIDEDVEGCEYSCTETNGGVEKCDGIDNDCDDQVDEDISKQTLENCGACMTPCSIPGARFSCETGSCELIACLDGFHDIDNKRENGCEYRCAPTNGEVEVCDGLDNDCNGRIDDGIDTSSDPLNCGGCGVRCAGEFPNAESVCEDGQCAMGPCESGYSDKDENPDNGCEYSCESTCVFPFAAALCEDDTCTMGECLPGYWDIDGDPDNGCEYPCAPTNDGVEACDGLDNDCNGAIDDEVDTDSDVANCGACGTSCTGRFPNSEPSCVDGECTLGACSSGYSNKDGESANGCEYSCQATCFFPFAAALCEDDTCTMGECLPGYWDIDGDPDNGCEYPCAPTHDGVEVCDGLDNDCDQLIDEDVDTSSDPANCGACGASCAGRFPSAEPSCVGGECVIGQCVAGYSNRDGAAENGCEYSCTATCFFAFAAALCDDDGTCRMGDCLPGYWDIDQDPANGCEYRCAPTHDGVEVCDGLDNDCNMLIDDAADTDSDPLNCGGCGISCVGRFDNAEPRCVDGECVLGDCLEGYTDVDEDPDTGCERSCDTSCSFPFATSSCGDDDGSCTMGECLVGYWDLDGDPDNGCEYSCSETNGGVEECDGLDNDCDGDVDEEFDFDTNVEHCGGCYIGCAAYFPGAVTECVDGGCQPTACLPNYANADGTLLNGCEYLCAPTNGGVETCDGLDNDCNGVADDEPPGGFDPALPEQCPPDDPEATCESRTLCQNGEPICVQVTGPSHEVCDGVDNDCDGDVDENTPEDPLPQVAKPCGVTQVGPCEFGTTVCNGSSGISCEGEIDPADTETCNGIDDDCNGVVDDHVQGQGAPCTLGGGYGACANAGVQQCMGVSGFVCSGATAPSDEVCDGPTGTIETQYDNDCDQQINENCVYPAVSAVRLDTANPDPTLDQTLYSTFQLAATSVQNNFLVVYADLRTGNGDIYGRVSRDAGSTWGANDTRVTTNTAVEVEPSPAISTNRGYVAYSRFASGSVRRIYVMHANSPYTSWLGASEIDGAPVSSVDCYTPRAVVAATGAGATEDRVAVVWSEIAGTSVAPTRNIKLSYSKNGGGSWSTPVLVNNGAGQDKGELPVIASDGSSMVYIAWRDKRVPSAAQAYFTRIDLSQPSPALATATALQPGLSGYSADDIVMSAAGQNVYVAWTDMRDDAKAIRMASSHDRGQTWSTVEGVTDGVVVNTDSTFADASDPALAARGDRVVAVWADTRSGKGDIRLNRSDDAGVTWLSSCPRVDTGDTLGASSSLLPSVALGWQDHVIVTWQDLRFPRSAVIANVSMNAGDAFHADAGGVYRMDSDTLNPGADSQSPLVLGSSAVNRASVVWVDFRASTGSNSSNGDVYARRIE